MLYIRAAASTGGANLKNETKEHWTALCERAAVEHDHEKLMELIGEITRMLDEKEKRLKNAVSEDGGYFKRKCSGHD